MSLPDKMDTVTVNNLSKKYGSVLAVEHIGFELKKGELVGLLGANGAGKSTTMKLMTGILQPDSGTVDIFGYNIEKNPVEAKKRTGYLSEDNPLPEEMYVREYLEYVAALYRLNNIKERVDESILTCGLKNEYRKKIRALSKGNRQKLGLAQALIHEPDLLILDEPANALDPSQQHEIRELVTGLSRSKIIVFSTHILHDIKAIATRVILLKNGRLELDKPVKDIASVEALFYETSHENTCR
ncbi:MAG: ABC transporter ATP-binding protein [Prevotella sp.]|jgi:ABC-2 type transport system ATP-binding protein|nr:ABC transporter ATP-binding protein [Prevotella sp.]